MTGPDLALDGSRVGPFVCSPRGRATARAAQAAFRRLKAAHPEEYEALYAEERARMATEESVADLRAVRDRRRDGGGS